MAISEFILASASPRRRELLADAGYQFTIHPADIDETNYPPTISPADLAQHLAERKAQAVADRFPQQLVLAADTLVAVGSKILGKPADPSHARSMLQLLSGSTHEVISGISILHRSVNFQRSTRVVSIVKMKTLSPEQIEQYVRSELWKGKAGGYGIQDERNDPLVTRISGSQTNIVGLPMEVTRQFLADAGVVPK